jgi:hypothetical protein
MATAERPVFRSGLRRSTSFCCDGNASKRRRGYIFMLVKLTVLVLPVFNKFLKCCPVRTSGSFFAGDATRNIFAL